MICRPESDHSGQGDSYNDGIRRVRPMTSWREPGAPHAGVSYPGEVWIPLGRRGVTPEQARKADALIWVTLFGIVILLRLSQWAKADPLI